MQRSGVHYVIRRNKPATWALANAVNDEERRVYGLPLQGRNFDHDNGISFNVIQKASMGLNKYE